MKIENEILVPMTLTEMKRECYASLRKLIVLATLFAVIIACSSIFHEWSKVFKLLSLLVFISALALWCGECSWKIELSKPLDGAACLRLRRLVDYDPSIDELVKRVQKSGREVAWADLWQANSWLKYQELAKQESARQQLKGVL